MKMILDCFFFFFFSFLFSFFFFRHGNWKVYLLFCFLSKPTLESPPRKVINNCSLTAVLQRRANNSSYSNDTCHHFNWIKSRTTTTTQGIVFSVLPNEIHRIWRNSCSNIIIEQHLFNWCLWKKKCKWSHSCTVWCSTKPNDCSSCWNWARTANLLSSWLWHGKPFTLSTLNRHAKMQIIIMELSDDAGLKTSL